MRPLRLVPLLAALVLPLAPAAADAARRPKPKPRTPFPVVESIAPRHLTVGQTLTVRGRNFLAGNRRNTVVFQRGRGPVVFVRAGRSSTRRIRVVIPVRLQSFLPVSGSRPVAARFRIRILARRFGTSFTSPSRSPFVRPAPAGATPGGGAGGTSGCDASSALGDADGDNLDNTLERQAATDPCRADTDGDGVPDGYEYRSALDYNNEQYNPYTTHDPSLPFPGKRPYPNALDPTDVQVDHDGDGLTLTDEYQGWKRYANGRQVVQFSSDGSSASGGYQAANGDPLDTGDGQVTDDEKDYDQDGLGNWDEAHGRMTPQWWRDVTFLDPVAGEAFPNENPYTLSRYAGTDWLDPDTDGDGLKDGPDDVDHDKRTNASEVDRYQSGQWTNPFNPCLPEYRHPSPAVPNGSPSCATHIPFQSAWMPWGDNGQLPTGASPPYPWPPPPGASYFP